MHRSVPRFALQPASSKSMALMLAPIVASWVVALLGSGAIFYGRFRMKGDGISYLDLADAYLRHDWAAAANTSWSPLYPAILSVVLGIVRPGPFFEFPTVHAVNLGIFLVALACVYWLYRQWPETGASRWESTLVRVALLWSLFAYAAISLVGGPSVTPDMLLLAVVLLISGLFLRIHTEGWSARRGASLGALFGAAYLTKAVFFPISLVCSTALIAKQLWKGERPHGLLVLLAFTLVAVPWVAFLSYHKGRPTFSDSGAINYCIDVGGCAPAPRPVPETEAGLVLFRSSYIHATYPPWYDLSERRQGEKVRVSLSRQWTATEKAASHTAAFLVDPFTLPFFLLLCAVGALRRRELWSAARRTWPILLIASAGWAAYLLTHVEERYIGPFLIPLSLPFLLALSAPVPREPVGWPALVAIAAGALLCLPIYQLVDPRLKGRVVAHEVFSAAQNAEHAGLREGKRIVVVGDGVRLYWPRLARVKIVGEFPEADKLWLHLERDRRAVMCDLHRRGVDALVTSLTKPPSTEGWVQIDPERSYALPATCLESD
jgi:hypothetical protein